MIGIKRRRTIRKRLASTADKLPARVTASFATKEGYASKDAYWEAMDDVVSDLDREARNARKRAKWAADKRKFRASQPKSVNTLTRASGNIYRTTRYDIRNYVAKGDVFQLSYDLIPMIVAGVHLSENQRVRLFLGGQGGEQYFSTMIVNNKNNAMLDIQHKILDYVYRYDGAELTFNTMEVEILTLNEEAGQGASRSMLQANKTWKFIMNKKTKTNCLYTALSMCTMSRDKLGEVLDNDKVLTLKASDLKRRIKPQHVKFADKEDLALSSKHLKRTIVVYNNVFQEIERYEGAPSSRSSKKRETIEIQRRNNHYLALLRYEKGEKVEDLPVTVTRAKEAEPKSEKPIMKYPSLKPLNEKIASWDIECSPHPVTKVHTCYAVGLSWYEGSEFMYESFWGLDAPNKFFDFLMQKINVFNEYTFYAHNGAKYDMPNMMKANLLNSKVWKIDTDGLIEQSSGFINLSIIDAKTHKLKINFKDSLRMLPGALAKLCKDFKVKHPKLVETVDHKMITLDNYMTFDELPKYLEHDCKGLLEIADTFNRAVYELSYMSYRNKKGVMKSGGLNITDCCTGATLAKKLYYNKYYNSFRNPIHQLETDEEKLIRESYFGGRVEITHLGEVTKPLYYLDFTSLYPDTGRGMLPYGVPKHFDFGGAEVLPKGTFGFVRCMVRTVDKDSRPLHSIKSNGRLIFPIFDNWTPITLFTPEIEQGLKIGMYEYKFHDALVYRKAPLMKGFFEDGFKNKALAKAEGKPALAQAWKIIINSGYGFWGTKLDDKDNIKMFPKGDSSVFGYIQEGKLISESDIGEYTILRVREDLPICDVNVGIASAITSYSRMKLHDLIYNIEKMGGNVYMCDTDSVVTDYDVASDKTLQEKFIPDGTGEALGSLKNELTDMTSVPDGEGHHFDSGYFAGCKFYALKRTFSDGRTVEICKCKGYKGKLTYSTFEELFKLGIIRQEQEQFRCGKTNYVTEDSVDTFAMRTPVIPKSFRPLYTKGTVDSDGSIKPLRI